MSRFVRWLTDPDPTRGLHLADDRGGWRRIGYDELASTARVIASRLVAAGVGVSDVVCLTVPTEFLSIAALFGAWAAGATMCPLPAPAFTPDEEYIGHVAAILREARPSVVVTNPDFAPLIGKAMVRAELPGTPWVVSDDELRGADPMPPAPAAEIPLLQFTSGSTGTPRGVRVTWDNLEANTALVIRWTGWRHGDGVASWLPLNHDMGLTGVLLSMVGMQDNLWLMRPDQFIRDPARWLRCFEPGRASHSATPAFALAYAERRVRTEKLKEIDLSGWRTVIIGADRIDPKVLESFARFAANAGFSPDAYLPAYGLAENTLAVTASAYGNPVAVVRPDWASLRFGEPVRTLGRTRLGDERVTLDSDWLVGHGRPVARDGVGVRVVDDDGAELPEGFLGEIAVSGALVTQGYHGDRDTASSTFVDGEIMTGDAGFILGDDLFVLGRMGDSFKLHGRSVFVEDLDARVAEAGGLRPERVAVVSAVAEKVGVTVFVESAPGPWAERITRRLRGDLGPEPTITIIAGRRGLIQRTSSGKPRRRRMWHQFHSGRLEGASVVDTSSVES